MVMIDMRNTAELDLTYRTAVALSLEHHLELPRSKAVSAITLPRQVFRVAPLLSVTPRVRLGYPLRIILTPLSRRFEPLIAVLPVVLPHVSVALRPSGIASLAR